MKPVILTCPYCGHNVPMPKGAIASDCPECGKAVFRPLRSVEILQKFGHGVQSTKTDPCGTPGAGVHEPPTMPKGAEMHCWHECVCMGYANRAEMIDGEPCTKQGCRHRPLGMVGARGAASDAPVGAVSEDQTRAPGGDK